MPSHTYTLTYVYIVTILPLFTVLGVNPEIKIIETSTMHNRR